MKTLQVWFQDLFYGQRHGRQNQVTRKPNMTHLMHGGECNMLGLIHHLSPFVAVGEVLHATKFTTSILQVQVLENM